MNNEGWSIWFGGQLTRTELTDGLSTALGVRFVDGEAAKDSVTYILEEDDLAPGSSWVLDVFAKDSEAAARAAFTAVQSRIPDWKMMMDLPELGQPPAHHAVA